MVFGKLEGAKSKIETLRSLVAGLGPKGSLTLQAGSGRRDLQINEKLSVRVELPFVVNYEVKGDVIVLTFEKPYPIATYRVLSKHLTSVEVSTEYVTFGLDWSPDITLEVTDG